jgi:hypothetical protein
MITIHEDSDTCIQVLLDEQDRVILVSLTIDASSIVTGITEATLRELLSAHYPSMPEYRLGECAQSPENTEEYLITIQYYR